MTIYKITSVSSKALVKREEYIDTDECDLFKDCNNARDVEREYNKVWFPQIQPNATDAKAMSHMVRPVGAQDGCWGVKLIRYDVYGSLDEILKEVNNHGEN